MTGVSAHAFPLNRGKGEAAYYYWFYFGQRAVEDSL